MLGRIEKSIEIKASPAKVWEMLALDRQPEWNPSDKSVEYTSKVQTKKDKYKMGASAHAVLTNKEEFDIEITERLENEKIVYRFQGIRGVRNVIGTFTLRTTEVGTKLTFVTDYELSNLLMKMFDKLLVGRTLDKESEKSLEKLKSILEK